MKTLLLAAATAAALTFAAAAHAGIVVDGTKDAAYGAATASVGFAPTAAEGNFGAPSNVSDNVAYDIYLKDEGGKLYGLISPTGGAAVDSSLTFANLYFDISGADSSNLGFEITNDDAFVPGGAGPVDGVPGITSALGVDGLEFSISNSLFTGPIAGLSAPGQTYPGGQVVLRLSQSFGYSVAGGASYGPDRLGAFTLSSGTPEPASWSLMILGFLGAGASLRASRRKAALAA